MSLISSATSAALDTSGVKTDREKLSATAKQFEALFVRQMLAAARKTDLAGEDNVFGSQALGTFRQMQDEHFADVTAESGSLGLASILEEQMARFLLDENATATGNGHDTGQSQQGAQ